MRVPGPHRDPLPGAPTCGALRTLSCPPVVLHPLCCVLVLRPSTALTPFRAASRTTEQRQGRGPASPPASRTGCAHPQQATDGRTGRALCARGAPGDEGQGRVALTVDEGPGEGASDREGGAERRERAMDRSARLTRLPRPPCAGIRPPPWPESPRFPPPSVLGTTASGLLTSMACEAHPRPCWGRRPIHDSQSVGTPTGGAGARRQTPAGGSLGVPAGPTPTHDLRRHTTHADRTCAPAPAAAWSGSATPRSSHPPAPVPVDPGSTAAWPCSRRCRSSCCRAPSQRR